MLIFLPFCAQAQKEVGTLSKSKLTPTLNVKAPVVNKPAPYKVPVVENKEANRSSAVINQATRIKETLFRVLQFADNHYSEQEKIELKKLVEDLNQKIILEEKEEENLLQRLEKMNGYIMGKRPLTDIKSLASTGTLTPRTELAPYEIALSSDNTDAYEHTISTAKLNVMNILKNAKEYSEDQKAVIEKILNTLSENFAKAKNPEEKRLAGHRALSAANDVLLAIIKKEPFETIQKLLPKEGLWSKFKNFFKSK